MTVYFLDSSALVKRYITETGSNWIQSLTDPVAGHTIIVARLTWVEVASAFALALQHGADFARIEIEAIRHQAGDPPKGE